VRDGDDRSHSPARARSDDGAWCFGGGSCRDREDGERLAAKFGRVGFRRNFAFNGTWRGRRYASKQVEACAVEESGDWLVITVLVKYFGQQGV
jgi:hypothetical protein